MQEVAALPAEVGMALRNATPLLLPVARTVLFPRELPLLTFSSLPFVGEVKRPDRRAVGVVGVLEYANVDADALLGRRWWFGWFTVHLDAEGGEPLTSRLFLDRDLLHGGVVGNGAVKPNRYICEFRKRQDSLTALLVELEARLVVRETAELPWRFPLELADAVAILLRSLFAVVGLRPTAGGTPPLPDVDCGVVRKSPIFGITRIFDSRTTPRAKGINALYRRS